MKTSKNKNHKQPKLANHALRISWWFLGCYLGMTTIPALADTLQLLQNRQTQNQRIHNITTRDSLKNRAKIWGLTSTEFQRYRWLMNNTSSAHWYKDLDPAEVLALNAEDANEMLRYAIIQAHTVHARVTQELAFDAIYAKAYKTLYPHEKPIMGLGIQHLQSDQLQSGDRVWLFVGVNTPLGRFVYQHIIKAIQTTPDTVLDIYFVGPHVTQKSIEAWATHVGISPTLINKHVTLNYGNDRFERVSQGKKLQLPFVGVVHDAHFQPIRLSSVL